MILNILSFAALFALLRASEFGDNQPLSHMKIVNQEQTSRDIWILLKGQKKSRLLQAERMYELEYLDITDGLSDVDKKKLIKMQAFEQMDQASPQQKNQLIRESEAPEGAVRLLALDTHPHERSQRISRSADFRISEVGSPHFSWSRRVAGSPRRYHHGERFGVK